MQTLKELRAEQNLLIRLKAGDPQAVQQWFSQFHTKLFHFIAVNISHPQDAEEVTQETFVNCLKHLPLFRYDSSIWTWMQSIARHEIADYYRKHYAKKAIKALPLSELLMGQPVSDAHDTAEKVKQTLKKLTQESQELLLMKYVDGKKVADIARELGRSVKAIESELFRARKEFRAAYDLI